MVVWVWAHKRIISTLYNLHIFSDRGMMLIQQQCVPPQGSIARAAADFSHARKDSEGLLPQLEYHHRLDS